MQEFEQLTQGSMSVADYSTRFTRLSRFAPALVMDEETRCRRFELGLCSAIRVHVSSQAFSRFSDLVSRAKTVERDLGILVRVPPPSADQSPPRSQDQGQSKEKRPRFDQLAAASPPADVVPVQSSAPIVAVPIQSRRPETRRCYHCQRIGHISYNCPDAGRPSVQPQHQQQQPQGGRIDQWRQPVQPARRAPAPQPQFVQGRVAALSAEEAQVPGIMVRGNVLFSQLLIYICVLIAVKHVCDVSMSGYRELRRPGCSHPGRRFPSVGTTDAVGGVLIMGVYQVEATRKKINE
ncbi:hypothetical protein QJS04_geneDACA021822 [Acorus gramineus]|uniref:CCHC-type domain-containing protein n=1 Tax=Acorus gramineus TaxID=55184 RepID=A0AAV9ABS1_ACOGR|nr:hypothetical protein QJS04_geneDACA021822 [Acorus gramineus]